MIVITNYLVMGLVLGWVDFVSGVYRSSRGGTLSTVSSTWTKVRVITLSGIAVLLLWGVIWPLLLAMNFFNGLMKIVK